MFINFAKDQTDLLDDELPAQSSRKKSSSFKKSMFTCVYTYLICISMNSRGSIKTFTFVCLNITVFVIKGNTY